MSRFRIILALFALLYLIVGASLIYIYGFKAIFAIYFIFTGLLILFAVLFERKRYKPKVSSDAADWVTTDEQFYDAATHKKMAVRYNPKTGERDYIEAEK